MDKIIEEIKEVLKNSPSRFAKVFYEATIKVEGSSNIKVTITSTLNYYGIPVDRNNNLIYRFTEKWHSAGLAVGVLEHYLDKKGLSYYTNLSKTSTDEVIAEITINV